MRLRGLVTATFGVLVLLAPASRVLSETRTPEDGGAAFRLAAAERFRLDFGLRSDRSFVRATMTSDLYDASEWGVPLNVDELRDLADRTVVRESLDEAIDYANARDDSAGVYVDQHRQGRVVFVSTAPASLADGLATIVPSGTNFEIAVAGRTMDELETLKDTVIREMPALEERGLVIRSVGVDIQNNAVRVGTAGPSAPVEDALGSIHLSEALEYYEQGPIRSDTCSSMSYCWPLKGGIRIYLVANTALKCTSGYVAKMDNSGTLVDLTAGHCLVLNNNAGTDYWGHATTPTNASNFADERGDTFYDYSVADVGTLTLDSGALSDIAGAKNAIHTSDPTTNDVVDFVRANSSQISGDSVCRMGWGTWNASGQVQGLTCGTVTYVNQTNLTDDDPNGLSVHIMHTNEVSFDSIAGDSGGPVWHKVYSPEPILYAYGTHVHSDDETQVQNPIGWYSPIDQGRSAYTTLYGSGYHLCTTAAC